MLATHDRPETRAEARARQRQERKADEEFAKARNAARSYGAALRQYARQIARIIEHHAEGDPPMVPPHRMPALREALSLYARASTPWARATATRMLREVDRRNLTAWAHHTRELSAGIRRELMVAPVGETMRELLDYQVELITSLPADAALRVVEQSLGALETGQRYPERVAEVEEALAAAHPEATDRWLRTRARLIANTETARAASVLVQARATHIGAEEYVWRTAGDWKVRESHRRLNRKVFRWDDPPLSDPPDHYAHPGQIFNCRCVALPIIPEG